MSIKIKRAIIDNEKMSYVGDTRTEWAIDLSDGVNNQMTPRSIMETFRAVTQDQITSYPHDVTLKQEICRYWSECAPVTEDMVVLGDGTQPLIYEVNRFFFEDGRICMGPSPQYSTYCSDVLFSGGSYRPVEFGFPYAFDAEGFIDEIDRCDALVKEGGPELALIYLDNPNNPTGQIISLADIEKIAAHAAAKNICLLVDEAYGEYMPKDNSAALLLPEHDNIIVARTFSKAYCIAGLRTGYIMAAPDVITEFKKLATPYDGNNIGRLIAAGILRDDPDEFLRALRSRISGLKKKITDCEFRHLKIAATSPEVPIMLIVHDDAELDLAKSLGDLGIGAASGACYYSLGANSVRLLVPREEDLQYVIDALYKTDNATP